MSSEIHLHLQKKHQNTLSKGKNIQLTHAQLHTALNDDPNVELHMDNKHINAMGRAHKNGKGVRIQHKHLHGGKISFGKMARQMKDGIKKALKNPIVKKAVKQLGHIAVEVANKKAGENGIDASAYTDIAHRAIENKNVSEDLQNQVANDVVNKAHKMAGIEGGRVKPSMQFFKGVSKGFKSVLNNPIVKDVASNLITGAIMGGSSKRHAKGSQEAKDHMAKVRAGKKGGALFPPSGAGVKKRKKRNSNK